MIQIGELVYTPKVTGFIVKLGDSLTSWKSKKQGTLSRSSAEYKSTASVVAEVVWITKLFKELGADVVFQLSFIVIASHLYKLLPIQYYMKELSI